MTTSARKPITLATVALLVLAFAAPAADARTDNRSKPVVIVHGFAPPDLNPTASDGLDCRALFGDFEAFLRSFGYGNIHTVAYYGNDTNCDRNVHGSGQNRTVRHRSSARGGHFGGSSSHDATNGRLGDHDQNSLLEHLGYHLAWNLRNNFGNRRIDIVAHSMGGLIVRYALQRVDDGHPRFPARLNVEDVVTMGSPHGGTGVASFCGATFNFRQCNQMTPNSEFLQRINATNRGRHPNPSNDADEPTDWTIMGSQDDEVVSELSALSMNRADNGVFYTEAANYDHDDYFQDLGGAFDGDLSFRSQPGFFPSAFSPGTPGTGRARRGGRWIDAALQRGDF